MLIHRRYSQPFGSDEIRNVIENVTGLAVERRADGVEGAESDALDLTGFQERQVGHGYSDPLR